MKRIYFLIIILSSFTVVACSSSKTTSTAVITKSNDSIKVDNYRIIVSFISTGQGIDKNAKDKFITYIDSMAVINHNLTKYVKTLWGREGEVDYCFKLSELSTIQQNIFVENLKKMFNNNKLVFLMENSPNMNIRK